VNPSLLQSRPSTLPKPDDGADVPIADLDVASEPDLIDKRIDLIAVARRVSSKINPHLALIVMVIAILAMDYLRGPVMRSTSILWPTLQAVVAVIAFVIAWFEQERLKLTPLLLLALFFQAALIGLHLLIGVDADKDASVVYPMEGNEFLSGVYPHSEYPVGAVLLFALESWLSDGESVRTVNALLMVPFQLATFVAVWAFRTRRSAWFAAVVALWPLNAYFWEFKFDAAPTAALAIGLLLAIQRRWSWAGLALGIGAAFKWTPGLAGVLLAVWLLSHGQRKAAIKHCCWLFGSFFLITLPFFIWSASGVLAAYGRQGGRGIMAESVYYIPLRMFGIVEPEIRVWHSVGAPISVHVIAILLQLGAIGAMIWMATRVRRLNVVVALAAMVPVVFFLSNRIFSPQFFIPIVAMWAIAGSLLARDAREQLQFGLLIFGATLANVLVYPTLLPAWIVYSTVLFALAFAATGLVLWRSREPDTVSQVDIRYEDVRHNEHLSHQGDCHNLDIGPQEELVALHSRPAPT
jgi:hypothetical protein